MKALVITSNHLRHKSFAKMLCEEIEIAKVIIEKKPAVEESQQEKEEIYFKDCIDWEPSDFFICDQGKVNYPEVIDQIKSEGPDIIFTFGCSLLKKEIFSIPKKGCVNIHTGMVQYFRGVDSPFWAIYEEKPEGIGATIHYIDDSIDAGEIIAQRSTPLSIDDNIDDVFIKSCITGFDLLKEKLSVIVEDRVEPVVLKTRGKLYQKKNKTDRHAFDVDEKIKRVIREYLND